MSSRMVLLALGGALVIVPSASSCTPTDRPLRPVPQEQVYRCFESTPPCAGSASLSKPRGSGDELPVGTLRKDQILSVIEARTDEIQACYESSNRDHRSPPSGKVLVEWTICPDGSVAGVRASPRSTLPDEDAACCMVDRVEGWRFNHPTNEGTVVVKYPFVFNVN